MGFEVEDERVALAEDFAAYRCRYPAEAAVDGFAVRSARKSSSVRLGISV